jgi:hypothetical protein
MAFDWAPVDFTLLLTTFLFVPMGIITLKEAVAGFNNEGMLTVIILFAVAAGVEKTGCLEFVRHILTLGLKQKNEEDSIKGDDGKDDDQSKINKDQEKISLRGVLYRLIIPLGALSTFLNNT